MISSNDLSTAQSQAQAALLASARTASLGFDEVHRFLRRQWIRISLGVGLGVGLAIIYWQMVPRRYESVAEVLVMKKDASLPVKDLGRSNMAEATVTEDLMATHIKIVQSQKVVAEALKHDNLMDLPSIQAALGRKDTPAEYVLDNLTVRRGGTGQAKNAHILYIAFVHSSPEDAQLVVNAVVSAYRRFLQDKFQDVSLEAAKLISDAEKQLYQQVTEAEEKYKKFRQSVPILWKGDESTNPYRDKYTQFQQELAAVQLKAAETDGRLLAVQDALRDIEDVDDSDSNISRLAVIDEASAPRIALLLSVDKTKDTSPEAIQAAVLKFNTLLKLKTEYESLKGEMGAAHPTMQAMRTQIQTIEQELKQSDTSLGTGPGLELVTAKSVVTTYMDFLKNDLAALKIREGKLLILSDAAERSAKTLVSFELDGEILRKDVERRKELYDAVVERLGEINLAKDYGGYVNEVIVEPEVGSMVWPRLSICMMLGIVLGSMVGLAGAAWAEYRDVSFRSPADIKESLNLPLVAHIPQFSDEHQPSEDDDQQAISRSLVCFHAPSSVESEAFRVLRTHVLISCKQGSGTIVQLTSANQGDGKSTMIANLAINIAQAGRRVLLVDCDLRRPRINNLFSVEAPKGLSTILSGETKIHEALFTTEVPNLVVLPCGASPGNPSELLESEAFGQFIQGSRQKFDVILLDTPPVLPVADPCIVARHSDFVLLTVRLGKDNRSQTARAIELLSEAGANLMGVVVNGVQPSSHYGYEYGYYGYTYRGEYRSTANANA
jgi:capsular exopolysaccharide synthesis family protein